MRTQITGQAFVFLKVDYFLQNNNNLLVTLLAELFVQRNNNLLVEPSIRRKRELFLLQQQFTSEAFILLKAQLLLQLQS
jgi:hypothetical protein